jgi:hypothetical protein
MLSSTLKYLYSVEPVRLHLSPKQPCTNDTVCNSIAHSIIREEKELLKVKAINEEERGIKTEERGTSRDRDTEKVRQ